MFKKKKGWDDKSVRQEFPVDILQVFLHYPLERYYFHDRHKSLFCGHQKEEKDWQQEVKTRARISLKKKLIIFLL